MTRFVLVLPFAVLLGCSPAKPAEPQVAQARSAGSAAPPASSTTVAETAAPEAPAPPDQATIAKRFLGEAPLSHVSAYVVDETCFLDEKMPATAHKHMTNTISIEDFQEGEMHRRSASTHDTTPESLKTLRAFLGTYPKGAQRFAVQRFSFTYEGNTSSSWRAYCLKPTPLFAGATDIGRIKRKDGTFDQDKYRVGFSPAALGKIGALPKDAWRLAFVWDDDFVTVLEVPQLKELKDPTVNLVALPK